MKIFAICCFAVAMFYGWTAVDAMRTGVVSATVGDSSVEYQRENPQSKYQRTLFARWLSCGGFVALGVVMQVIAGRFEKLEADDRK